MAIIADILSEKAVSDVYSIGKNIREFRLQRGISQKQFAAMIGAKNTTVSNWEKGLSRPDVDNVALICDVLNVSADDLLDIHLSCEHLSAHEQDLLLRYRQRTDMQKAVNLLLGINE